MSSKNGDTMSTRERDLGQIDGILNAAKEIQKLDSIDDENNKAETYEIADKFHYLKISQTLELDDDSYKQLMIALHNLMGAVDSDENWRWDYVQDLFEKYHEACQSKRTTDEERVRWGMIVDKAFRIAFRKNYSKHLEVMKKRNQAILETRKAESEFVASVYKKEAFADIRSAVAKEESEIDDELQKERDRVAAEKAKGVKSNDVPIK